MRSLLAAALRRPRSVPFISYRDVNRDEEERGDRSTRQKRVNRRWNDQRRNAIGSRWICSRLAAERKLRDGSNYKST